MLKPHAVYIGPANEDRNAYDRAPFLDLSLVTVERHPGGFGNHQQRLLFLPFRFRFAVSSLVRMDALLAKIPSMVCLTCRY